MDLDTPSAGRYAKLAPPLQADPLRRARLFELLDGMRRKFPAIWLAAPPGAGKTTLAASYLANAGPLFWYRLDADDADPSWLFYFLAQALPGNMLALPRLSPMPPADQGRCARLFFREFFAAMPEGATLVLDNVQEFDWEKAGHLLEPAFSEIPRGRCVMALSRDQPPPRLARLQLEGVLAMVGGKALRFDHDEARALARAGAARTPPAPEWLEQADGWAAGIVMLRDAEAAGDPCAQDAPAKDMQTVFRYFSGEVLSRMPASSARLLLMLSPLPDVSAEDALMQTGDPGAAQLLERLHASQCFVERREGNARAFRFHPLFHRFLRDEAHRSFSPVEMAQLQERAAGILDNRGQAGEAVRMYREAAAHDALADLLLRHAPAMLAAGEGATWISWLSCLPPAGQEANPWLWYWQGSMLLGMDDLAAGAALRRAGQVFHAATGICGCLVAAALVDHLACWQPGRDRAAFDTLAAALASGLAAGAALETGATLLIRSRMALALVLGDAPAHHIQAAIRDTREALAAATDPQIRLGAGAALLQCRDWLEPADAAAIEADLSRLAAPAAIAIAPAIRAWWGLQAALCRIDLAGEPEAALALLEPALALAAKFGLDSAAFSLESAQLDALLAGGDPASARKALARLRTLPGAASRSGRLALAMADARLLLEGGDSQAATRRAAEALPEQDGESGEEDVADPDGAFHRMAAALHAQAGDAAGAAACYAMAERMARGHGLRRVRLERRLAAACCASRTERPAQAADALRDALAEHRAEGALALFPRHPQLASALSAFALREKIEVPHVRGIVRRQRLAPPDCLIPEWPWPIAVRTLGKLEIWLDGDLVKASGKAPQRPLMLLKALLCGGESGKSQAALADQLWPEAESARSAVNVTIHRLRKLLGTDAAIVVASGTVALNRKLVWTDISDLCKVCNRVENLPAETAAAEVLRLVNALLDLYRGPFCEGEESSWLIAARDRWRNHFLAAVAALGKRLEAYGAWTDAIRLYLHALDNEPLAEAIHRGLMRCAHARNDSAAAYSAYRRCRDTLSIVLGRKPSPETEKLAIALGLL